LRPVDIIGKNFINMNDLISLLKRGDRHFEKYGKYDKGL